MANVLLVSDDPMRLRDLERLVLEEKHSVVGTMPSLPSMWAFIKSSSSRVDVVVLRGDFPDAENNIRSYLPDAAVIELPSPEKITQNEERGAIAYAASR